MKFNLVSLTALAVLPSMAHANVWSCGLQADCIEFTMSTKSDTCGVADDDCAVEVCMYVSSTANNNACTKSGTFSHMCHMSDSSGCPALDGGEPMMGIGPEGGCSSVSSLTGQGDSDAWTGKCGSGNNMLMCQEGKPGDTLYWILKDGGEGGPPHKLTVETDVPFTFNVNGCDNTVTCSSHDKYCSGNSNQAKFERTWAFTIPDGSGTCANPCDGVTPTDPISPSGPTTPTDPTPPGPSPTPIDEATPAGSQGDPHFRTWKDEHFEYHGQCDLLLAKDPKFADGLGIDVQIRTKLVRFWSYIKSAAIRIGNDVFEVEGDAVSGQVKYWFNMQLNAPIETLGGFPLTIKTNKSTKNPKQTVEIDLSSKYPGVKIEITTWKEFVKVNFIQATEAAFGNAIGMLGDFKTGKTLARDGVTVLHDFYKLGNEWQVLPEDLMLFHKTEEPQFPKKCIEPEDPRGERRRRMEESSVTEEQAEKACASLTDEIDRKDCIYDIIATQDMDMVGAY